MSTYRYCAERPNVSQHPLTSDDVNHLMVESIAWREKRGLK